MNKYHYVYMLTHKITGEFYIGVRSSKVEPDFDDYMGSMMTWEVEKHMLKKEILAICVNRRIAEITERAIIKEAHEKELNRNFNFNPKKREKYLEEIKSKKSGCLDMTVGIWNDIVY